VSNVVAYEVVDRVAHVIIDRPDVRNAMDLAVFDELHGRAEEIAEDPHVGAVVLRGRGGNFSSGLDVSIFNEVAEEGSQDEEAVASLISRLQSAFNAYEDLAVPTIAAIEGYAFGAGLQLALACHLRMAAPSAQLSVMEPRWGLVPDLGGTYRLPRLVGLGRATELALTTRVLDADEALKLGLVEVALDAGGPQQAAHTYAARLAAGPGALRHIPRLMRENLGRDRARALAHEAHAQMACFAGPDFFEAVTARRQGRSPNFEGL